MKCVVLVFAGWQQTKTTNGKKEEKGSPTMKNSLKCLVLIVLLITGCASSTASSGGHFAVDNDGGGEVNPSTDTVGNDTIGKPDVQDPCAPYAEQVKFLEGAGTWKKCIYHKTYVLYNLTFKSEVDKAGRCIAVAIEDETASVLCSTAVPGENKFTGMDSAGTTPVECSK